MPSADSWTVPRPAAVSSSASRSSASHPGVKNLPDPWDGHVTADRGGVADGQPDGPVAEVGDQVKAPTEASTGC